VEQCLRAHSPSAGSTARLGTATFIHRFGSGLNAHLHFRCAIIDSVSAAAVHFTATATSARRCERPLAGKLLGNHVRLELVE